jgi:ankyrin repeat protein
VLGEAWNLNRVSQFAPANARLGVGINAKTQDMDTPLHWGAASGNDRVVESLLMAKADVNPVNRDGNSPLHVACAEG